VRGLPWWTEADDAELSALVWELVDGIADHRPRCASCARYAAGGIPCAHIGRAVQAVLDWIYGRELLSRARWFRYRRDELELGIDRRRLARPT